MAKMLKTESRRLYSWWWDSHISPKNSKWLQEDLTDMDAKVKAMIKLIEEDADSFARRAEMYYKKRPELMKLVEEFYRAYRALAERYDHATGELRHAQRTLEYTFSNQQLPYEHTDDSTLGSSETEPHTPEMPHRGRTLFDLDDMHKDSEEIGKSLDDELYQLLGENQRLKIQVVSESERSKKAKSDVEFMRKTLADTQSERESLVIQYQQSLDKVSNLDKELHCALKESREFDERAIKAETEKKTLKDALSKLEADRDAGLLQYKQSLVAISNLESMIALMQERFSEAETESQKLKQQVSLLKAEKEAGLHKYNQCLEKISSLKDRSSEAETESQKLKQQVTLLEDEKEAGLIKYNQCLEKISSLKDRSSEAETESQKLKQQVSLLEAEKEAGLLKYNQCLEKISSLKERSSEAEIESQKLKRQVSLLEVEKEAGLHRYNQCLEKISSLEDKVLLAEEQVKTLNERTGGTETEINRLRKHLISSNEEKEALSLKYKKCLDTINKLENDILRAQEDAKRLNNMISVGSIKLKNSEEQYSLLNKSNQCLLTEVDNLVEKMVMKDQELNHKNEEMENGLQMLKDMEVSKHELEKEILQIKEQNQYFNELNLLSTASMQNMMNDVTSLREIKEKLEDEATRQRDQSKFLEEEIYNLKEEIKELSQRYQALMEQVTLIGFPPECLGSSVKELQDENSKLKEICKNEQYEKESISNNLENMENLEKAFHFLQGEKSSLVAEKAILFSHMHVLTQDIQKLWEKNASLESSLAAANIELAGLREKSKGLEEICQLLRNDKSGLIMERGSLVCQLKNVEGTFEKLENRFAELERKYTSLEKEKASTLRQVEELQISIALERQEHESFEMSSEARLVSLEDLILQERSRLKRKDFEEELDKSVNAQVEIFILQKFIQDLEDKNISLWTECQKHVEASQLSDKLISELESENLEQQTEAEFLVIEIEKLRKGISQVFGALKIDLEHACLPLVLESIEKIKLSASENEEEAYKLQIKNLVLVMLLGDLKSEGIEFNQELTEIREKCELLQRESCKIMETNMRLQLEVNNSDQERELLKAERENLHLKLENLHMDYHNVRDQNLNLLEEHRSLLKEYSNMKTECEESKLVSDYQGKKVLGLSKENNNLNMEVECLHVVNGLLESELNELHEVIEDQRIKEENLSSELQEKSNEFEIWEAEAASFYFDLQTSSTREVFLENKVHELTGLCESLEKDSTSKNSEIEQMKERLTCLENENGGLKMQLADYVPVIVSLKGDIASLEHNALFQRKLNITDVLESEDPEMDFEIHEKNCLELTENKGCTIQHGVSDLQKMQRKIKAVEKAVVQELERLSEEKRLKINTKQKSAIKEIETSKSRTNIDKQEDEIWQTRNRAARTRDISLDQMSDCAVSVIIGRRNGGPREQMLELWQTAEQNCTSNARVKELIKQESASMRDDLVWNQFVRKSKDPSSELEVEKPLSVGKLESSPSIRERTKEAQRRRVLERLTSDAQKLMSIQVSVEDLRKKAGTEKNGIKKSKNLEYATAMKQLHEVEESVIQIMDINGQLTKNIGSVSFSESKSTLESKDSGNIQRKRVLEQARKESEKIGRLELDMQRLQFEMLKLEDEKKLCKVKNRFSQSATSIALGNFIHLGRSKSIRRRKKPCLCGCLRPSTNETEVDTK